jgi:ParB family transcriptional regulator, chromosome partitioning protein
MAAGANRGLGKGLSALISENYTTSPAPAAKPAQGAVSSSLPGSNMLSIEQLVPGKYQPRTQFNPQALNELAESIKRNGIMQPIIVRPTSGANRYEIIAGERRWRASKLAGLAQVPVIIREINDKQALELALVENVQRQDLSPLEEANGYQRLIEEFDYTQEELASVVGKSRSHVTNLLRLLSLPDDVKDMLDKGELTMGHARALLTAPDPLALATQIVSRGLSVRQAEQVSREVQGNEKRSNSRSKNTSGSSYSPSGYSGQKDPDIIALEETLSENLGLRVSIHDRGQSGEIVLTYDSLSQLDEILRRLGDGV